MKTKFMNFVNRLSRHEMSTIMGGYPGEVCMNCYDSASQACYNNCGNNSGCDEGECLANQMAECTRVLNC